MPIFDVLGGGQIVSRANEECFESDEILETLSQLIKQLEQENCSLGYRLTNSQLSRDYLHQCFGLGGGE